MANKGGLQAILFPIFKYSVYLLLCLNVVLFFQAEWQATDHLFSGGVAWTDIISGFAATIDTAAWVVLLLMFELETFVLPDEKIKGGVKTGLETTRVICYLFIVYAFYGYVAKCMGLYELTPVDLAGLCELAGGAISFMTDLDEYEIISIDNCAVLATTPSFFELAGSDVVTDADTLRSVRLLAWTDVLNAGAWLFVVAILEFDVRMQLKNQLQGSIRTLSKIFKAAIYSILIGAAIYWGFAGDFLDFWDAFLWILAFVFIELNVFEWHAERSAPRQPQNNRPQT